MQNIIRDVLKRNVVLHSSRHTVGKILTSSDLSTVQNQALDIETEFNRESKFSFSFLKSSVGLFRIEQLSEHTGFIHLEKNGMAEAEAFIRECFAPSRSRKMVEIFDDLSNVLCKVADLAEFVYMAHPDGAYVHFAEKARNEIGGLVEYLNTNRELYDKLKDAVESGDVVPTTDVDQHVAKLLLFDFEQCGIHLDSNQRSKVAQLNDKILSIGSQFQKSILDTNIVSVKDLPEGVKKSVGRTDGYINMNGFLDGYRDENVREFGFKRYLAPSVEQDQRFVELLESRHELAVTCGFNSYAERALRGTLAETSEVVSSFLDQINAQIQPMAREETKEMEALKKKITGSRNPVAMWDLTYLTSIQENLKLGSASESDIIPYFSLGSVIGGLSDLFKDLFGVSLVLEETGRGETWDKEVKKLSVVDENMGTLGHIYCDLFSRPGKSTQDCQFTIRCGKQLSDGTYQNPISVLHMNLSRPQNNQPTLLSFSMLENVFHEMGHGIHSMLGRTQYQHVSGTRCSTDFAEVPSVLMEFFAKDPRVLQRISRHTKTGEQIPLSLLEPFLASRNVFPALELQRQIFYSAFDQKFHGPERWGSHVNTMDILAEVQSKYYHLPYIQNTASHLKFGHIVGYGAKYYSYMMCRAVASWIWQKYFQENPFNRESGMRLRNEVLAHGGGKPPKKMISDFLAREVSPETLTNALLTDVESIQSLSKHRI